MSSRMTRYLGVGIVRSQLYVIFILFAYDLASLFLSSSHFDLVVSLQVSLQAPPERIGSPPRRFIGFTLLLSAVPGDHHHHHSTRHRGRIDVRKASTHRSTPMEAPSRRPSDTVGAFQVETYISIILCIFVSTQCAHRAQYRDYCVNIPHILNTRMPVYSCDYHDSVKFRSFANYLKLDHSFAAAAAV